MNCSQFPTVTCVLIPPAAKLFSVTEKLFPNSTDIIMAEIGMK